MIVDSCIDPATGNPIAIDYLRSLGLDLATAIRRIVITHWHDDHIRGVCKIARLATDAEIVCSAALKQREFKEVIGVTAVPYMIDSGIAEMKGIFEILVQRRRGRASDVTPIWASSHKLIFHNDISTVHALSPSDATFTRFLQEIGNLIPEYKKAGLRAVSNEPNEASVVLWVEFGATCALLGADLERGDTPTGWQAIINSPLKPTKKAKVIKVPHHGSRGAHHERVWSEMLEPEPYALVTPYRRSALPTESDLRRLTSITPSVYCTAPTKLKKPTSRSPTVDKMIRRTAPDLREVTGPMGQITLRIPTGTAASRIHLSGAAFQVSPA